MDRPLESNGHMDRHPQNDWASVRYDARFDEYWVEAGAARQLLFYCPWCGEKLPPSRRDDWFDALEAAGIDPFGDAVPADYQTGAWRGAAVERIVREPGAAIPGRFINLFQEE